MNRHKNYVNRCESKTYSCDCHSRTVLFINVCSGGGEICARREAKICANMRKYAQHISPLYAAYVGVNQTRKKLPRQRRPPTLGGAGLEILLGNALGLHRIARAKRLRSTDKTFGPGKLLLGIHYSPSQ